MPRFARLALGLVTTLLAAACGGEERSSAPDVIFVSLDSVRADDLTFADAMSAPNLTALAERGTVFRTAISGSSWTLPTHVQMLTGQPPTLHRVESDDVAMDPRTPTLARTLRDAGYHTAGVWSGWYVAPEFGFGDGFLSYRNAMTGGDELDRELRELRGGGSSQAVRALMGAREVASHEDVTSERVAELAQRAVEEAGERPLFLFAHFFDPHYDYIPPGRWADAFDPDYSGDIDGRGFWNNPKIVDERGRRVVSDRDLEHVRALYRGEIGWTDQHVGAILDALRAAGRLDDALVIVVADHGEEFFEHGRRGHRQTLYDEVIRVPLLVAPPLGAPCVPHVDQQVDLSDLMPTALDYAGVATPESVWGRSLRPAVEGEALEDRVAVSSLFEVSTSADGRTALRLHETLRTDDEKLWRVLDFDERLRMVPRFVARYDLAADPGELEAISGLRDETRQIRPETARLWQRLEEEVARMRAHAARLPRGDDSSRQTDFYRLVAQEMGALGYAEGGAGGTSHSHALRWGLGVRDELPLPAE